jgi:hypothetical protein
VQPRQPSLFGVEASDPIPEDLAGLLAGPGELHRMGGTARVGVAVDAGWRVHALVAEFALRGLPASWEPAGERFLVRTAYTTRLLPLARAWRDGPPAGLHLAGPALRLWVAAAGAPSEDGYLLGLGSSDQASWPAVGAALSAAGLAAALVVPGAGAPGSGAGSGAGRGTGGAGADGPAYRITGRRRLARLAELVGDPPGPAPAGVWPVSPGWPIRRGVRPNRT